MQFQVDDSFRRALWADPNIDMQSRAVYGAHYSYAQPVIPYKPEIVHVSEDMLRSLGISDDDSRSKEFLNLVSGTQIYPRTQPYAQCYAGHQFGNWAGQLGDGRAIQLMEIIHLEKRWTLQLKGAGPTPYSRNADGFAVLRSSIREHLCSEAMHGLGIPTTRSLSLVLTGDKVWRDMLYDGHPAEELGAIVCRVAPSFIRFGNFEIMAAQKNIKGLQTIVDYTIDTFFPTIQSKGIERYVEWFRIIADSSRQLVLDWMRVGFVHGVLNTDNMSILGLSIDYGPFGFLDNYDPSWTPNTTDAQGRRYRFENQPQIFQWNLLQLANAIYPLIEDADTLNQIIQEFIEKYRNDYSKMMASKLGITSQSDSVKSFVSKTEDLLTKYETDYTIFFRELCDLKKNEQPMVIFEKLRKAFYSEIMASNQEKDWIEWAIKFRSILEKEEISDYERSQAMKQWNPKYILRNYMAQEAIDAANMGDYSLIDELYQLLRNPYHDQFGSEKWYTLRPEWARKKVGCSMLSCSS